MSSRTPRRLGAALALLLTFGSGVAAAAGKVVEEASAGEKKEAADLYTAAMTDFEADRYEPALEGFRRSYAIVKSPNSHFMIARSLARLGRNVEAYEELEAVIAEASALGGRYEDTVTAAHAKEDEIRPRIGLLTVNVRGLPKGTQVTTGGEPLPASQLGHEKAVLPGNTVVAFTTPDGARGEKTAHFDGGDSVSVELSPALLPSREPPPESSFIERDDHGKRLLSIEGHLALEVLDPPGRAVRGVGPGGRISVPVLRSGLVAGLNDELAVNAGADWIGTSNDPHVLIPVSAEYGIWLTPDISASFEPGASLLLGAGTRLQPVLAVGVRCRLVSGLHFVGRLGVPASTLGLAWVL